MARAGLDNTVDGHTIESIAFILDKDPIIEEKWAQLASKLGIEAHRINKFRNDVRLDKITHADLISAVLELWKGMVGSAARFDKLQHAVKELGAVNVRESLEALQTTAEIANYSGQYVKALQQELAGVQIKTYELERELVAKCNIVEMKNKEIKLQNKEYQKLLREKSAERKGLDDELLGLRAKIRVQQLQLDDMKILNGRLEANNATLKKMIEEKEQKLLRTAQEKMNADATIARLKTDNEDFKRKIGEHEKALAKANRLFGKNKNGDTELHVAVDRMDESTVRRLVEEGANLEARNNELETPLYRASDINDRDVGLRIIKYLIDKGANGYTKGKGGMIFLHNFVVSRTPSLHPNITPSQFHDIVEYLMSKKLAPLFNITLSKHLNTPLTDALMVIEVTYETLIILKENLANFKSLDIYGESILQYPLKGKRSIKLIKDIIQLGVPWDYLTKNRSNLLHTAADSCHVDGVKYFINKGMDVNGLTSDGCAPIHRALYYAKPEKDILPTVRVLIDKGANLKIMNIYGETPLSLCLSRHKKNKELIQMLTIHN